MSEQNPQKNTKVKKIKHNLQKIFKLLRLLFHWDHFIFSFFRLFFANKLYKNPTTHISQHKHIFNIT